MDEVPDLFGFLGRLVPFAVGLLDDGHQNADISIALGLRGNGPYLEGKQLSVPTDLTVNHFFLMVHTGKDVSHKNCNQ